MRQSLQVSVDDLWGQHLTCSQKVTSTFTCSDFLKSPKDKSWRLSLQPVFHFQQSSGCLDVTPWFNELILWRFISVPFWCLCRWSVLFCCLVPAAGQYTPAQTLPGLAGHLGQRACDQRHGCRQPEVADGSWTRRHVVLHYHLQPGGPPLSQH